MKYERVNTIFFNVLRADQRWVTMDDFLFKPATIVSIFDYAFPDQTIETAA